MLHFFDHYRALKTCIIDDLLNRFFKCLFYDLNSYLLVLFELKFFPVIVRRRLFYLSFYLFNPSLNLFRVSCTLNNGCIFFIYCYFLCPSKVSDLDILEFYSEVFRYHCTACENCNILKHCLPPLTKPRCLYSTHLERAAKLIHHKSCKGLSFNLFRNDEEWFSHLCNLFEYRQGGLHTRDLFLLDEGIYILQGTFHSFRIGDAKRGGLS